MSGGKPPKPKAVRPGPPSDFLRLRRLRKGLPKSDFQRAFDELAKPPKPKAARPGPRSDFSRLRRLRKGLPKLDFQRAFDELAKIPEPPPPQKEYVPPTKPKPKRKTGGGRKHALTAADKARGGGILRDLLRKNAKLARDREDLADRIRKELGKGSRSTILRHIVRPGLKPSSK